MGADFQQLPAPLFPARHAPRPAPAMPSRAHRPAGSLKQKKSKLVQHEAFLRHDHAPDRPARVSPDATPNSWGWQTPDQLSILNLNDCCMRSDQKHFFLKMCGSNRTLQHSSPPDIYDPRGLAPTVSTTSAISVWADETRVRLLQPRELARLQGLNHFHLPAGRVVATRLIGNAIPPALVVALFFR